MQTPTHLLVASAALSRRNELPCNLAILIGALLPDLSIYILFAWSKVTGIPESRVWGELYWLEPWQTWSAISNSVPLWGVLLAGSFFVRTRSPWLWAFAVAGLLHLALDFPVHHGDAHKHFWPLTNWRFHSPLSYWNPEHHGHIVSFIEIVIGTACIATLWRRFASASVRAFLAAALFTYFAVPVYFRLTSG